jgi:glycosyltransferase involved in cell wall biosynthesis
MSRVSVIIPAYEAEPFLDAALASVAAQSRRADEVVVVDDGSRDGTAAVAESWGDRLPLILVRKAVNEGLGAARRDGIARSSGDLVAFLDADDYLLPDHLQVLTDCYDRHGGIIAASGYRWRPEGGIAPQPWHVVSPVPPADAQPTEILRRNIMLVGGLVDRASYDAAGGFRPLRSDEDWDLWIRMIRQGARVTLAPAATVLYRNRPTSLSAGEGTLRWDIELLEELRQQVSAAERPIVDEALRRRHARQRLLQGYEHARAGRTAAARSEWARAALGDRSLRGGVGAGGSVTLKAVLCLAAPRRMTRFRDERVLREVRL